MHVLIVNIGSTSLKFRLFDMADERVCVQGTVEGIGAPHARVSVTWGTGQPDVSEQNVPDQAAAVALCQRVLTQPPSGTPAAQIDAVGFKAVHGGHIAGAVRVTPEVIGVMENFTAAAPAHNPAYIAAMQAFERQMPTTPLVAAFETGFHQTIPPARTTYAIPHQWTEEFGVRRYGFHGASHRYVAARVAELMGREDLRLISCHLGGSSSICAIQSGRSIANSFGMTPQTGLPQNNRVGDFDPYALLVLQQKTGLPLEQLLARLAKEGGLLGISGISNDMAAIVAAADRGEPRAMLALDVFIESVRHYIGAYVVALGGLDVLVFTGGIGERAPEVRRRICTGLEFIGVVLDVPRNNAGGVEATISPPGAPVRVLILRTNEELIVARQVLEVLQS